MRKTWWSVVAFLLIAVGLAMAQNQWPTPDPTKSVTGIMMMCQDSLLHGSVAVPCSTLANGGAIPLSISTMNNMPSDSTAVRNWNYPYNGDVMCMHASSTKAIRLRHILVSVTGSQAMQTTITLARRDVPDIADPDDTPAYVPPRNKNDDANPPKTGGLTMYRLKPSFGQPLEGELMRTASITVGTGTPGSTAQMLDFNGSDGQPIVLRNEGMVLCVNIWTPVPGGVWNIAGEWMETDW